jgi:ADP-heptose:LPS heptosyltransferase
MSYESSMKKSGRIAVLRALHLGDMLCAVPALRALRAAQPRARITLIGLPWAAAFVERFSAYVDDLMVLPPVPGMPEQSGQSAGQSSLAEFIEEARWRRFDLAIQLHGSGVVTNDLLLQLGAARNAGFYAAGRAPPDKAHAGRTRFLLWQEVEHEVLRCMRLMQTLGAPPQGNALEFPLAAADFDTLREAGDDIPEPGTYVCIHAGARMPSRRWNPERFAEVADLLAQQGLHIVLTGSEDERGIVDAVEQGMQMPAVNLCGKTSLGAFAALVSQAALVVCNDTGASHVAAATGTPSVVICSGSDPLRWAPLDRHRHRVLSHAIFCRPCMHQICPIGHPCALNISVDMVMEQANELLELGISPAVVGRNEQAAMQSANRRLGRSMVR